MSESQDDPYAPPKPVNEQRSIGVLGVLTIIVCCLIVTPIAFFATCFAGVLTIGSGFEGDSGFAFVLLGSLAVALAAAFGVGRLLYGLMAGSRKNRSD